MPMILIICRFSLNLGTSLFNADNAKKQRVFFTYHVTRHYRTDFR